MKLYSLRWLLYGASVAISAALFLYLQNSACDLKKGACFQLFAQTLPFVFTCLGALILYAWKFLSERSRGYTKERSPITLIRVLGFCLFGVAATIYATKR